MVKIAIEIYKKNYNKKLNIKHKIMQIKITVILK